MIMKEGLCEWCWTRGKPERQAEVEFRGELHCTTCKSYWIDDQLRVPRYLGVLPQNLRRAIRGRALKYLELAHSVGVTPMSISKYASEDTPLVPSMETFLRLCAALRTTPNELLDFTDGETQKLREENLKLQVQVRDLEGIIQGAGLYDQMDPKLNLPSKPDHRGAHYHR